MSEPASPSSSLLPAKKVLFWGILALLVFGMLEVVSVAFLKYARGYDGRHFLQYQYDSYKNLLPARGYLDTRGVSHNAQ